jgi:5'-3' exonuclease
MSKTTLVDGGWLSYNIAYQFEHGTDWDELGSRELFEKVSWCALNNMVVCLDAYSTTPVRRKIMPDYKCQRAGNEKKYGVQWARVLAHNITDFMHDSPLFKTVREDGLEADDLIARYSYENPDTNITVYGVDKDLLQLPNVVFNNMYSYQKNQTVVKLYPGSITKFYEHSNERLITLALILFGDVADNVPRLNKPRDMKTVKKLLSSSTPFTDLLNHFSPEDIWKQVNATTLPMPILLDYTEEMLSLVLEKMDTGDYWIK